MPFKPGQSGNPAGKPKGAVSSITQAVRDKLREKKKGNTLNNAEMIVEAIIDKAIKGDKEMLKLTWNYIDGLPKASMELDVKIKPIPILPHVRGNNGSKEDKEANKED